jgi:hypothetical protein
MSTTAHSTAIGVFSDRIKAFKAIGELHRAGFDESQIGFVGRNGDPVTSETIINSAKTESAVAGVVGGGVIGGALGAAVALLIPGFGPAIAGGILGATLGGAALGATAGGFIGALEGMGIPQADARYYQDQLESGSTIVTVQAGPRYQEALDILHHHGSYDATDRPSIQEPDVMPGVYTSDISTAASGLPVSPETYDHPDPFNPYDPDVNSSALNGNASTNGSH